MRKRMKRREIVVLAAVVAKLRDKAESDLGGTNTRNGSSWYSSCQLLFWYDSNELWKSVEKPAREPRAMPAPPAGFSWPVFRDPRKASAEEHQSEYNAR